MEGAAWMVTCHAGQRGRIPQSREKRLFYIDLLVQFMKNRQTNCGILLQ
jgi:hypothetical protein